MKAGIHPNFKKATVKCACGNEFETGSVKEEVRVEICSECHPFYTGRQKFASADGRVDRFNKNTVLSNNRFLNRQAAVLPVFILSKTQLAERGSEAYVHNETKRVA